MPNLVVYVPAGLARELDALGVSLEDQRRACHAAVRRLADGEPAHRVTITSSSVPVEVVTGSEIVPAGPRPVPERAFRPDPKGKK